MGQREDRAIGYALTQLGWPSEVVGHKHGLAVPGISAWTAPNSTAAAIAANTALRSPPATSLRSLAIPPLEPVLDRDQAKHAFVISSDGGLG